jgi:hypothetical protein
MGNATRSEGISQPGFCTWALARMHAFSAEGEAWRAASAPGHTTLRKQSQKPKATGTQKEHGEDEAVSGSKWEAGREGGLRQTNQQ